MAPGDMEVNVASTVGFNVGDIIAIEGGGQHETRVIVEIRTLRAASASASSGTLVLDSALSNHYPSHSSVKVSVAATPIAAGGGVAATGDPHLQNVHGERFDLMKPGKHVLINIPRGSPVEKALLRVEAKASRLGGQCADMYFQEINITGQWVEAEVPDGLRFQAPGVADESRNWITFGKVQVKVAHGHTRQGIQYLNFYVKHLRNAGFAVGGLLGEDDHRAEMTPSKDCLHRVSF